ncbi:MAG: hypothetical protein V3V08_23760 [Nannocystaceae bacterium]
MLPLLELRVATRLEQAAEKASDQVGGRASFEATRMLEVVRVDGRFRVRDIEVLADDGARAEVRVRGDAGSEHVLSLVYEEGRWRIRVPGLP